jgi:hypothetical protein
MWHNKTTMHDFTKRACVAIEYMNQCCPDLFVGLKANNVPMIRFLDYCKEWDEEPQSDQIKEYKEYTSNRISEFDKSLKSLIDRL